MKILKFIYKAISTFIIILLVVFTILLIGTRAVGFQPYAVLTGSMAPKYPVGSFVYVREIEAEKIEIGDAITFYINDKENIVTHQVIDIESDPIAFETKGIANDVSDANAVEVDNLIGKVYFCVPYMGYLSDTLTNPPGLYYAIGVIVGWFVFVCLIDIACKIHSDIKASKAKKE
ncbi:MAG: signal peptidase I [Clostridia bacterium]